MEVNYSRHIHAAWASGAENITGTNPGRIGHFWPFAYFGVWERVKLGLRGSWARASEQNKMAEQETDYGQEPQERQVINALSLLRAPEKSDLARKRKISSNNLCKKIGIINSSLIMSTFRA